MFEGCICGTEEKIMGEIKYVVDEEKGGGAMKAEQFDREPWR